MKTFLKLPGKFYSAPNKIKLIHSKRAFYKLLASIYVILLIGCTDPAKVALETKDSKQGKLAIEKITDQEILAKVSLEAKTTEVRLSAIEKLTDQSLLAKIAINANEDAICLAAAEKMTDQLLLSKIVSESQNSDVCVTAIERMTNPSALATIAFGLDSIISLRIAKELQADPNSLAPLYLYSLSSKVFAASVVKLKEISETTGMEMENEGNKVRVIYQLISAFDNVPENYRNDKISAIMPAFIILNKPEVMKQLGEVITINAKWEPISESYHGDITGTMPGEWFQCSIKLKKLTNPLIHSWGSAFPMFTSTLNFLPAEVNYLDIFGTVLDKLPQKILENIAMDASDQEVQCGAVKLLTNKSVLSKLAEGDDNTFTCIAAKERIAALNKLE